MLIFQGVPRPLPKVEKDGRVQVHRREEKTSNPRVAETLGEAKLRHPSGGKAMLLDYLYKKKVIFDKHPIIPISWDLYPHFLTNSMGTCRFSHTSLYIHLAVSVINVYTFWGKTSVPWKLFRLRTSAKKREDGKAEPFDIYTFGCSWKWS